ncbi:hypothetical protein RclHR1_30970003 [Rhizophagus clarus]|uniref:Uncharacterized protein n=1 Tax=Rhizophagus clarus TaxID=94130 RepID=A0A2Z6R5Z2_9GLOM|nr:hypothetical protein RclHR1_30970003 [Rhizophagus clarus]
MNFSALAKALVILSYVSSNLAIIQILYWFIGFKPRINCSLCCLDMILANLPTFLIQVENSSIPISNTLHELSCDSQLIELAHIKPSFDTTHSSLAHGLRTSSQARFGVISRDLM